MSDTSSQGARAEAVALPDDNRIRQLMKDVGQEHSRSLYQAFKQIVMETRLALGDTPWSTSTPAEALPDGVDAALRASRALVDNINEFGQVTDHEILDNAEKAVRSALGIDVASDDLSIAASIASLSAAPAQAGSGDAGDSQMLASARLRPEPGGVEKLRTHARAMSDALIKVRPLAGSEMFSRVGEEFYADPRFCGAEIERLRAENIDLRNRAIRVERAALSSLENSKPALADAHSKPDPLPEPDKEG